jgi:hypothetical protein
MISSPGKPMNSNDKPLLFTTLVLRGWVLRGSRPRYPNLPEEPV